MSLRVGVNARLLAAPTLRGWNRYTVNLLTELLRREVEVVLYSDQPVHADHLARFGSGNYSVQVSPPMRYFQWEQRWLPAQCGRDRVDVLHSPFNFGLPWSSPCPRVLTLHDAIDQLYYGRRKFLGGVKPIDLLNRLRHWASRQHADAIITVSRHARGDLIEGLGLPASKIRVIYEAADPRFLEPVGEEDRARTARKFGLDLPYIFYVGGWEERKNIPFLLNAFARAELAGVDLVLAGGRDDQRAELTRQAESLGILGRLRLLGWVDEADLPALYSGALGFAYPSEYEGFGLQICEAMALGCPVLAARATSLTEILGEGGETFSLTDTNELSALLKRLAVDDGYRSELKQRARTRSADFTWSRAADETIDVYRSLLSEASCVHVAQS